MGVFIFSINTERYLKPGPSQPELIGQDWSDTPYFRFTKEHPNASALTDLLTIESSGKKIICSTVGMTDQQGEYVGAGYYCFTIYPASQNAFYEAIKSLNLSPNLFILDRNENIIFSADPSEMGKDASGKASIQWLLQEESTERAVPKWDRGCGGQLCSNKQKSKCGLECIE